MITNDFNTKITPATVVGKQRAYVTIPEFQNIDIDWTGASNLVCIFNYVASGNFTIESIDVPYPLQSTQLRGFIACIRWIVNDETNTVYRYKLIDNVNGLLDIPMYNGEFISSRFTIEIWSTNQPVDTFNNYAPITLNLSIRNTKPTIDAADTYENTLGVQCTDIFALDNGIDMPVPLTFSQCAAGIIT